MSHPRLPEISQISGLPHHSELTVNIAQICKISKISTEWEHRDLEIVNYVNEKNFLIGQCRQVSPKPDADWKMSVVAMKFIQDAA